MTLTPPSSPRGVAEGSASSSREAAAGSSSREAAAAAASLTKVVDTGKPTKILNEFVCEIKALQIGDTEIFNNTLSEVDIINIISPIIRKQLKDFYGKIDDIEFNGDGEKYVGWGYKKETEEGSKFVHDGVGVGINYEENIIFLGEWTEHSVSGMGLLKTPYFKYYGNFKDNERHGLGEFESEEGIKYKGGWQNEQCHGKGTLTDANGKVIYEGEFEYGSYHGKGKLIYANGNRYEGKWQKGQFHGQGTYAYENGDRYEGEWKNGYFHGQGTLKYANGDENEGFWENGYFIGEGKVHSTAPKKPKLDPCETDPSIKYPDETIYRGEILDGQPHGQGILRDRNRNVIYEGKWKNGHRDGCGIETLSNGDRYEGEWKNGHRHGTGTFTNKNDYKYEGEFQYGKFHGQGKLTKPSFKYEGEFQCGKFHGQGKCEYETGDTYVGKFINGMRHRQGIFTWANGNKYEGKWQNGQRHGTGTFINKNGYKYEGGFKSNSYHGKGTIFDLNGEVLLEADCDSRYGYFRDEDLTAVILESLGLSLTLDVLNNI